MVRIACVTVLAIWSSDTYRLLATPDAMRGRMSSTVQMVVQGANSVGAIVGGILIQDIGAKWSALILGAWLVLLAIATTLNKRVRQAAF
jgi:predicted MFS family arabinose efflux permease